jgi:hypothetical protein
LRLPERGGGREELPVAEGVERLDRPPRDAEDADVRKRQ